MRAALAASLVCRADDRERFEKAVADFFGEIEATSGPARAPHPSEELGGEWSLLQPWVEGGVELDRLAWKAGLELSDATGRAHLGFDLHRAIDRAGAGRARRLLSRMRPVLRQRMGVSVGNEVANELSRRLRQREQELARRLRRLAHERIAARDLELAQRPLGALPFSSLTPGEAEQMGRAVRELALRLGARAQRRERRARRYRLDPHRTMRYGLRTSAVPVRLFFRRRRREQPRLVLLCDVSDSVRPVARFLLELIVSAHEIFPVTRSFVFVSDVAEITQLLSTRSAARSPAIERLLGAAPVSTGNSNYGHALRHFAQRHLSRLDRRSTVVILGDGRTNYFDPQPEVLDRIRARVHSLVWLATERRSLWSQGDNAMSMYAPRCTRVLEVCCLRDLERAARQLAVV